MNSRNRSNRGIPRLAPLAVAVALCLAGHAQAATITLTTGNTVEAGDKCTLQDAVKSINQGSDASGTACSHTGTYGTDDTILLQNHVYTFGFDNNNVEGDPMSSASALVLSKPMTLIGSLDSNTGQPLATIQRETNTSLNTKDFRVIETNSDLTLIGVTIQDGISDATSTSGGLGGGILAVAADSSTPIALTLVNSVVTGNQALSGPAPKYGGGGGIFTSYAHVVLRNSSVGTAGYNTQGNTAYGGGGIAAVNGYVSVYSSTINGNQATGKTGGGIYTTGAATLINSTLSGNYAKAGGGGIDAYNALVEFSTLVGNTTVAGKAGGGMLIHDNSEAYASLMVNNSPGNDMDATSGVQVVAKYDSYQTKGNNVTIAGGVANKACSAAPSSLDFNGGPTQTMALTLAANACEIDAGPTSTNGLASDQRGALFERRSGTHTDIGAFEYQPANDRIFYDGFELP